MSEFGTDPRLHKALWANIMELRVAEEAGRNRRKVVTRILVAALAVVALALAVLFLIRMW